MKTKQLKGWWDSDLSPHLEISTPAGEPLDLVVDSGFNGEVTLPLSHIKKLGLKKKGYIYNRLADGSTVRTATFVGEILWFGQGMQVMIQATHSEDEGLLGTELFQGCTVELDMDEDLVVFRKKPSKDRRRRDGDAE
jgi:clan AA aspartic protease